jgi:subtilisin
MSTPSRTDLTAAFPHREPNPQPLAKALCMTPLIEEQLSATGIAQVIVVLNVSRATPATAERLGLAEPFQPAVAASKLESLASDLAGYFVSSDLSQDTALVKWNASRSGRRSAVGGKRGATFETAGVAVEGSPPTMRLFKNLGLMLGTTDRKGVAAITADRRVRSCTGCPQISLIRPVISAPSKLAGPVTWGLDRLGIPTVWKAGYRGKGVLVGHLDTGVDGAHAALKGAIARFAEFDLLGNPVAGAKAHDSGQHGTHTAGTILGRKVRATEFGVAPEAKLASALVIEGGNVIARILGGMDWIVGLGATVLSMSLGLRGYQEDFLPVTQVLRERGVLPVFAVGNEGPGTSRSPGNYPEALSVGACDEKDQVADFSSSQRFQRPKDPLVPDLVAPGTNVISSVPGGGYAQMSGTSMATPHVAGLAALLWQAKMTATVDEIETAIFASSQRPPGMLEERGNRGIPNGPRALAALLGTPVPTATSEKAAKTAAAKRPKTKKPRPKARTAT